MSEYIIELPNGGAADECIRLRGYEKNLYGYELHEEIVRCRDCAKLNIVGECPCGFWAMEDLNGYCKWGERRDND